MLAKVRTYLKYSLRKAVKCESSIRDIREICNDSVVEHVSHPANDVRSAAVTHHVNSVQHSISH